MLAHVPTVARNAVPMQPISAVAPFGFRHNVATAAAATGGGSSRSSSSGSSREGGEESVRRQSELHDRGAGHWQEVAEGGRRSKEMEHGGRRSVEFAEGGRRSQEIGAGGRPSKEIDVLALVGRRSSLEKSFASLAVEPSSQPALHDASSAHVWQRMERTS